MLNEIDYKLQSAFKIGKDRSLLWFPNIFWGKGYAVADKERLERVLGYLYITVPLRSQFIGIVLMCFLVGYLFFRNPIILMGIACTVAGLMDFFIFMTYRKLLAEIKKDLIASNERYSLNDLLIYIVRDPNANYNGFFFWLLAFGLGTLGVFMGTVVVTKPSIQDFLITAFLIGIVCFMFYLRRMWFKLRTAG